MSAAAPSTEAPGSGNVLEDLRGYRRALGHFATGVTVVTAAAEGQLVGMTANSFSSVSLDPPLILWSIDKRSQSFSSFESAGHFAVNVLAADQLDLASRFARSGADKFAGLQWRVGQGGAPCLPYTVATFECCKHQCVDAGDHVIMIGRVLSYVVADRDPLVFLRGRFALSVDYPVLGAEQSKGTGNSGQVSAGDPPTMLGLLWDAFAGLSQVFQAERDVLGLNSVAQGRVLSLIERLGHASPDVLAPKAHITPQGLEEALHALQNGGYLSVGSDGLWLITDKGRVHVAERRKRAVAIEASQLKAFSASELETTCRVLRSLGAALPTAPVQATP